MIERAAAAVPRARVEIRRLLLARPLVPLSRPRAPGRRAGAPRRAGVRRAHRRDGDAALHGCAPVRRGRACRPCSTARARGRSSRPTRSAPTRTCCSTTCGARRRWSRRRLRSCSRPSLRRAHENGFRAQPPDREGRDARLPGLPRRPHPAPRRRIVRQPLAQHAAADRLHRPLVSRRWPPTPAFAAPSCPASRWRGWSGALPARRAPARVRRVPRRPPLGARAGPHRLPAARGAAARWCSRSASSACSRRTRCRGWARSGCWSPATSCSACRTSCRPSSPTCSGSTCGCSRPPPSRSARAACSASSTSCCRRCGTRSSRA